MFQLLATLMLHGQELVVSPRPITPPSPIPPLPITKDYSPYLKPPQHPDRQIMSSPDLTQGPGLQVQRRTRKQVIIAQLASLKHWFLDSAKRATSPSTKLPSTIQNSGSSHKGYSFRSETRSQGRDTKSKHSDKGQPSQNNSKLALSLNGPTTRSSPPKRNSISPQPLTPHSSYRRSSVRGLGGRNSTSSSVSSIRSFHNKSHSKASSTSSASITSTKTPRSPRGSLKIHPSTPTHGAFPSSIRVVRGGFNEAAILGGGQQYARRKRTPLKGPLFSAPPSVSGPSTDNVFGGRLGLGGRKRDPSSSRNSDREKGGGGIIEEEEEEVEEVTEFEPLGPGEKVVGIEHEEEDDEYDDGDSDTLRGRN